MTLTPTRIVLLLASTLVLSIAGIVLMAMGVHGSRIILVIGAFLLLPNVILSQLGVRVGIPFLRSTSIMSAIVFLLLQAAYYYALFRLIYYVVGSDLRIRPRTPR